MKNISGVNKALQLYANNVARSHEDISEIITSYMGDGVVSVIIYPKMVNGKFTYMESHLLESIRYDFKLMFPKMLFFCRRTYVSV